MLGWLIKLINPIGSITKQIIDWKVKQENAEVEKDRIEASLQIAELEAQRDILLAEQSNFFTRMVRPLWALPFVIYTWKIIVWDKVLGLGVTDPLDEKMWGLMMLVAGAYFVFRGSEKLLNVWKRK